MPLEDLTGDKYVNSLVSTNPTAADDRSEGDNHIRGSKNVIKKSFPLISGPVQATHTELSGMAGYIGPSDVETRLQPLEAHVATTNIHFADAPDPVIAYARTEGAWVPVAGGGTSTLDINTAGAADDVNLDMDYYRDAGGDNLINNQVMSYNILGSVAGRSIYAKVGGNITSGALAVVGKNGQAHGWLSAQAIASFMATFDPTWNDDDYAGKSTTVVFVEDDGAGGQVDITPTKTVGITKKTVVASIGGVEQAFFAWNNSGVPLDMDVRTSLSNCAGKLYSWEICEFQIIASTPDALITVDVISGGAGQWTLGYTNGNGNAIGQISALNIYALAGVGQATISVSVGGVFKMSKTFNVRCVAV